METGLRIDMAHDSTDVDKGYMMQKDSRGTDAMVEGPMRWVGFR